MLGWRGRFSSRVKISEVFDITVDLTSTIVYQANRAKLSAAGDRSCLK